MRNREKFQFAQLFRQFEDEYGDASVALAKQLREDYPEITKPYSRTTRALQNICFSVWCCVRDGDRKLIPTLFRAAVLLSAQDDYYDNPSISAEQKETFCRATNDALRANSFQPDLAPSLQAQDLIKLWSDVAGTIPRSAPQVHSYWIEKACQLNDAMAAENRDIRRATLTYDDYMSVAIHSIGMVFVWVYYLAHKHVSVTTLREMEPVLLQGARVVRWSNDIASCRQQKNKVNAVTLMGGSAPGVRILRLVAQESRAFRESLESVDVGPDVRGVLLRSMDFFREFYQRSDFDRRADW
jgi:hypothetical protein